VIIAAPFGGHQDKNGEESRRLKVENGEAKPSKKEPEDPVITGYKNDLF
jgi:hypothetical protein